MIRIEIYKHGEIYTGICASGHSGYDEAGSDIVCAAVSTLMINCMNSIEHLAGDPMEEEIREEDAYMSFRVPDPVSEKSQLLILSAILGLQGVAAEYEECISIGVQEV